MSGEGGNKEKMNAEEGTEGKGPEEGDEEKKILQLPPPTEKNTQQRKEQGTQKEERGIYRKIMNLIPEEDEKIKNSLKDSVIEGSANAVMLGTGENYINPLAVRLNASDYQLGFLESVPQLVSSFLQLFSVGIVDKIRNRKKIILPTVLIQAFVWLVIIADVLYFKDPILLIFLFTIEVSLRSFMAPAWNSLMSDLVNERVRGKYFGLRNKITGMANFVSVLIGGRILYLFSQKGTLTQNENLVFYGFAVIFTTAFVARIVSWYFMRRIHEKQFVIEEKHKFSLWQFVKRMPYNNFGMFVIFMCFFNFAVWLASPFFTVYMLRELGMNFWSYTLVNSASAITTFLVMTYWGKYSDIFGNRHIFEITGYLIPLVPLLWIFSRNPNYLIFVNIFSGFVWAGFNLSSSNYIYDAVTPQKRVRCIAYYTFLTGIAIFLGAVIGASIVSRATPLLEMMNLTMSRYHVIFLISGVVRAAVVLYFIPKIKEVRVGLKEIPSEELFVKLIAIEPIRGFTYSTARQFNYGIERIEKISHFIDIKEFEKFVKKNRERNKGIKDSIIKRFSKK